MGREKKRRNSVREIERERGHEDKEKRLSREGQ